MNNKRIFYLDWLRVVAFWILILFHSWQPFTSFEWMINTSKSFILADVLSVFFHTWRLHLIFFISGVGTWFALQKAEANFLKDRFKRLIVPFIFASIFIIPSQHYFEALQDGETNSDYFGFILSYHTHLLYDHNYKLNLSRWNAGVGLHLWYLTFLFTMTFILLPIMNYLKKPKVLNAIGSFFTKKANRLFLLIFPIILSRLVLKPIFPAYTDFADFVTYSCSFLYGFILISNHDVLINVVQKNHRKLLFLGGLSSLGLLASFTNESLLNAGLSPSYNFYHLIVSILIGTSAFAWTLFWVSFFSKNITKNNIILKSANESILPIYIIHQSIIVCIGYYIITLNIAAIVKFLLIVLVTVLISITFYRMTRKTKLSRFLVGMKKK